jgi:integrase
MSVRKREWYTERQKKLIGEGQEPGEKQTAWIADYSDQHGKRHIKTFTKKKDADAWEDSVRVNIRQGVHVTTKLTVAKASEQWIESCEASGLEASTLESYRQHLAQHIIPFIGAVRLSELTLPMVRDFMDRLRKDGRSPAMIKRVVGDLGAILADAMERGNVAQNVVRSLRPHRKKRKQAERRQKRKLRIGVDIPSPDEIRAIVAHLSGRWRPLLLTAIFAGLRASELRGLRWSDVDLRKSEIHVRQRADKFNKIGDPKSEAGERTIPIPPILVNALREWKLACPKSELNLVFPTGAGEIEYHSNIVTRGLAPMQVAAGVITKDGRAKYTGLHSLRHFYASWCINRKEEGGLSLPLKMVQHRLGHSTIQMTADVYGHLFPSGDDGAELAAAQKALLG